LFVAFRGPAVRQTQAGKGADKNLSPVALANTLSAFIIAAGEWDRFSLGFAASQISF
jgi:hypothetical protein